MWLFLLGFIVGFLACYATIVGILAWQDWNK